MHIGSAAGDSKGERGAQVSMNLITTALIVLELSWIEDKIRQEESTGYSSLTRALVLASQAGRMTRLLRVMNLVGVLRVILLHPLIYSTKSVAVSISV